MPAVYFERFFVAAGGLISYGTDSPTSIGVRLFTSNRILKGETSADLPVQAPTRRLVLKCLVARADEVIE